jgi:hypothetical protein
MGDRHMLRRRDDPRYVRSALATLAFYASVLALLAAAGFYLRWGALAGLGGLLLWLYRGPLFGAERWPERLDVGRLLERERERAPAAPAPAPAAPEREA